MSNNPYTKILFLDIETVSQKSSYDELSQRMQNLWNKKSIRIRQSEEETPEETYKRAGIYAEFGKIVCISIGYFHEDKFRVTAIYGDDEREILETFSRKIVNFNTLCAHNGKEFDFPYICRRMLINGLKIPYILDVSGKKPWETAFLDTMEMWRFGDYKNYTSLELLTAVFDIPTPKDDIDGSMVGEYYWEKKEIERIAEYCKKDVIAIAQLFLRYKNLNLVDEENIIHV